MGFFRSIPKKIVVIPSQTILDTDSNTAAIGIPEFDPEKDYLTVYKNSVYLSPDNYNVVDGNIVSTNGTWVFDTVFDFLIEKVT